MSGTLDIAPLRSLVAIADCGGFQRAASSLHLSQGAVSQHVRRLESATGRALVVRHGRGSRFTTDGEQLLVQARRILALHDDTLRGFGVQVEETITIGSTEHAAAQLLPALAAGLAEAAPDHRVRFRLDRGARLRESVATGAVDLALLLQAEGPRAELVGELDLSWYAAPTWTRPDGSTPVPVVAFDNPCSLRTRALETLSGHDIPAVIGAEATQLAGVQAAVAAGLGVALMATLGHAPQGLVPVSDLPTPEPLQLYVCSRPGLQGPIGQAVAGVLRPLLRPRPTLAVGA
ncbi:LysR family transcriptional regulator [Nocardioides sp. Root1257]|uniref:LysR substrate-binding domain-containing protein n=1 Tax=unclassified Nocardioides TaxID=2615069 RepID=UPI0006FF01FA|nr:MULTISPECIES: LysR substrate-binding domain-containing protein [unclassified Nocardioides]KQW47875.1 LysR family transcriptional regulator [Nocardioides sp. Root1257]KRC45127.1 LysR family transcriptional regulator [Nocardioides sp. Root224]